MTGDAAEVEGGLETVTNFSVLFIAEHFSYTYLLETPWHISIPRLNSGAV